MFGRTNFVCFCHSLGFEAQPRGLLIHVFLLAALFFPVTAWTQRIALVIGNAAYADRPLRNPVNDAQLMQATLRELGFQVQVATDVDRRGLLAALRDFEARARGAEVALFYFAGHGAQVGGANYLIPVNAPIRSETDVPDEALDAASVLRRIEEGRARVGLVILDACRDNPYPGSARSSARGLARMSVPTGTIVAYATAPGSTADDGGSGPNGLYTGALARYLATPGLDIKEVFDRTAQEVERLSNGRQRPREEIGLRGRFVINDLRPALATQTPAPAAISGASSFSLADLEREAQVRRQWAEWQQRMQADFDRAAAFQESPDLRVQAWQRFLGAWKDDNPTTGDDERLREQAQQRMAAAQREVQQRFVLDKPPVEDRLPVLVGSNGRHDTQPARPDSAGVLTLTVTAGPGGAVSPGQNFKDCAECPEMAVIPAGRFLMGSPPTELGSFNDEGPQRWVDVPRFAMGRFEVTQGQWHAVMGSNPSRFKDCGVDCPVERVSWNDAQEFVRRLSQRTGQTYRLPSEAEWEYSARAGTTTAYFWGDRFESHRANSGGSRAVAVGRYPANAFGLHDMNGNVWEWVEDVWHASYVGAPSDGSAWMADGDQSKRVLRGGSWGVTPQVLRSAQRARNSPASRYEYIGFRVARTF
jgi:formylglycine-generating enzyme required for sulfatase activity